jgi:hypothetical protein
MRVIIIFKDGRADAVLDDITGLEIEEGFVIVTDETGSQVGYNSDEVRSFLLPKTSPAGRVDSQTPTQ